jgi:RHS repeat-associated protein
MRPSGRIFSSGGGIDDPALDKIATLTMQADFIYDCIPQHVKLCALMTSRHTGKERDSESGLDYFGARHYSSSMGRFSSPDPSGLYYADLANPQSFNLYSYAQNNPLKNIDPTGLDCVYLNDAGTGVDTDQNGNVTGIDHNSNQTDCNGTGGYWAPGNVASSSDVHTFSNSDLIGVNSTTNGQGAFSIANCAGCSTSNSNGSLMGAMTQTFGTESPAEMSLLFSNIPNNPLPRPMDQVSRWPPLLTQTQIYSLCSQAVALRFGGNVPGDTGTASNSPTTLLGGGTTEEPMQPVPGRGAVYGDSSHTPTASIPMNAGAAQVDNPLFFLALAGGTGDCVKAVSGANK